MGGESTLLAKVFSFLELDFNPVPVDISQLIRVQKPEGRRNTSAILTGVKCFRHCVNQLLIRVKLEIIDFKSSLFVIQINNKVIYYKLLPDKSPYSLYDEFLAYALHLLPDCPFFWHLYC